jgi:hypothetical protein
MAKGKTGKNWIRGAVKKKGALRRALGAKQGKPIPRAKLVAAARKPGKLGQRARLALTFRSMNRRRKK